jgi:hypothetical protein
MTGNCARFSRIPALVLLAILVVASSAFAGDDEWKPKSDMDKLYQKFCRALEDGDRKDLEKMLSPEWTMFITVPSVQTRATREEFFALFDQAFAKDNLRIVVNDVEWGNGESTIWCRADEYHDWVTGEGKPRERSHVLSTHIFEKRDGKWLMVHTHHSWIPAPGRRIPAPLGK